MAIVMSPHHFLRENILQVGQAETFLMFNPESQTRFSGLVCDHGLNDGRLMRGIDSLGPCSVFASVFSGVAGGVRSSLIVTAGRVAFWGWSEIRAKPRGFFHFVQSSHGHPIRNAQIHERTLAGGKRCDLIVLHPTSHRVEDAGGACLCGVAIGNRRRGLRVYGVRVSGTASSRNPKLESLKLPTAVSDR